MGWPEALPNSLSLACLTPADFPDIWLTSPNCTLDYVVVGVDPAKRSTFRLKTVDNRSVGLAFCQYSKKILTYIYLLYYVCL